MLVKILKTCKVLKIFKTKTIFNHARISKMLKSLPLRAATWVAMAPFELKLGPNESYGRAASVGTPPGAKKAQI